MRHSLSSSLSVLNTLFKRTSTRNPLRFSSSSPLFCLLFMPKSREEKKNGECARARDMTELLISQIGRIIQVHIYKYNIENEQKQNQTKEGIGGIIFVFLLIFAKKFSRLTGLIRHIYAESCSTNAANSSIDIFPFPS